MNLVLVPLAKLPRMAAAPTEMFRCEKFHCGMLGSRCVERQLQREGQGRGMYGEPTALAECNPAKCEQGRAHRQAWPEIQQIQQIRRVFVEKKRKEPERAMCEHAGCKEFFLKINHWQRFCSGKCADAESYAKRQKKAADARAARPPRIPKPPAPTYAKKCEVCGTGYEAKKETSRSCINLECRQEISVRVRAAATLDAMHALGKRCELPACGATIRETRNPDGTLNLWLHKRRRFCDGSCAGKYGAERARQQRAAVEAGRTAA